MKTTTDTTTHLFEIAGLGAAPYRFVGVTKELFQAVPGDPSCPVQPGTCCDYCHTAITFAHWFVSAEGTRFKVGCDCFYKANNCPRLRRQVDAAVRKHNAEVRAARAQKSTESLDELLARDDVRAALSAKPHPRGFGGLTALDYATWMRERAGATGRAKALKSVRALLAA